MIRGVVIDHSPYVEVEVFGNRGRATVIAILDTGFSADLYLPIEIGITLGLELWDVVETELADGTVNLEPSYVAHINWGGEFRMVDVILTYSDEALLGTRLLEGKSVKIDFRTGEVIIE